MKAKLIKLVIADGYRLNDENGLLIATTLEGSKNKLSLKNCQAIERGYDLDELAKREYLDGYDNTDLCRITFKDGFQKAVELMGDKKFSEEDVKKAIFLCCNDEDSTEETIFESLQQTEWDVDIEVTGIDCGINDEGQRLINVEPKLDADGCLILKRI